MFYTFPRSDRGDSPWCSSLNHSYETLNMVDSGSEIDPNATPLRNPHRPAPPVPATASPVISRKSEASENHDGIDPATELDAMSNDDNISIASKNRRKVKHQISRRILRQRKIHSLKRQIQIKEKMLEVSSSGEANFFR